MNMRNEKLSRSACGILALFVLFPAAAFSVQPKIGSSPDEVKWPDLLKQQWGLDADRDLRNPLIDGVSPPALFVRADKGKPVVCRPVAGMGMPATVHGGWYPAGTKAGDLPADPAAVKKELWTYAFRQTAAEVQRDGLKSPPITSGAAEFDPGERPFGFWVRSEQFDDGGVYTQPGLVAKANARLKDQPYKAMIYPCRDAKTGEFFVNSYLIGWEYSTNDDFQDVVMRIDNVRLLPSDPALPGILAAGAKVEKLAGGFTFVEGPAWDFRNKALYFSDIPKNQILRYADGKANVANDDSGQSNGLMFDKEGLLIRCEHKGRRVSRGVSEKPGDTIVAEYNGKKLNSPNDLWIDTAGGIYFTDPRYGSRDSMELDKEAVYYITPDKSITRIIDDLVRPNGIALSPDGKVLYIIDNGAGTLHRYPVQSPGKIGKGERIAYIPGGDGMTVDEKGRLYLTGMGGVWVVDGNGKWIGLIETPEKPANCTFGGKGYRTLFVTAVTSLYAVETKTRGWHVHLDGVPGGK